MNLFDLHRFGLPWPDRYAKTQIGLGSFFWLRPRCELPVFPRWMFDDSLLRRSVRIVKLVLAYVMLFVSKVHHSLRDVNPSERLVARFLVHGNTERRVGGVGDQPPLSRVYRFKNPFACEGVAIKNVEGSRIERLITRVCDPQSTANLFGFLFPYRDF